MMSRSRVAVVCPVCETRDEVRPHQAGATVHRHNDHRHGGDAVASIAGAAVDTNAA